MTEEQREKEHVAVVTTGVSGSNRRYYERLHAVEAELPVGLTGPGGDYLVTSLETADGGKAGILTEVSPQLAAKLIIEHRAILADLKQVMHYRGDHYKLCGGQL